VISKSFSRSLEQFFLTVGQNNFGNKKPMILCNMGLTVGTINDVTEGSPLEAPIDFFIVITVFTSE
jgi:hypothetical protein